MRAIPLALAVALALPTAARSQDLSRDEHEAAAVAQDRAEPGGHAPPHRGHRASKPRHAAEPEVPLHGRIRAQPRSRGRPAGSPRHRATRHGVTPPALRDLPPSSEREHAP